MRREDLIAPPNYNIAMEMERHAKDPNKLALIWENQAGDQYSITYNDLVRNANRIGNAFLESGLQKGDKILVMVPRLIKAYEVYLAALKTGIIIIPSSEMLKTKDLQYRVTHGEVRGIISYYPYIDQYLTIDQYEDLHRFVIGKPQDGWLFLDGLMEDASDQLQVAETRRDDIAFLPYTSGTTGNPKGVVHTHGWGFAHLKTAAENWLSINNGDKVWATAGPGWQKWVWSPFLSVLGVGATGYIYNGKFDAKTYLQLLQEHKINVLCCTPTEYRMLAKADHLDGYDLSALHSAVSAGEPLNVEVIDTFQRYFNITVRDGYGQTENTLLLGFLKGMEVKPGSMGKPTPGNDVDIIDENGEPVTPGEVGDIAVRLDCPALFREYYKDEERTNMSRRREYYITGDQASKDEEGYFWFEGRSDDIIISSGYTIGPFEVEDALVKHPAVQECAVVASPDELRGNIVKAFIVLRDGSRAEEPLIKQLQDHVKTLTGPYKYPRKIEFIDELPKTTSGKTRRVELRNREKIKTQ
ncbi:MULTISPECIES: acyl-CoA synthetase MbcS [Virgibacillus]|uniref:Acyl--CoA ligase n=1 Tax=Virgibacillus kapii TaxID=1638645 RepID=A0ABQ2DNU3_9BACI|nr:MULTISPECIES: acyl--CoA ligase [Virgibacillus]EQB36840.1 acyl--CoA ligase [Virgibacillus sp. CM-4]GGJ65707.1 acyl--CoA ligase [Virgibacillus kapii]